MADDDPTRWIPTEIGDRAFRRLDLEHPEVGDRIMDEIQSPVAVYYDRRWPLTGGFCRFLVERPDLLEGKRVFVAGAGVGMEAVVAGALARSVVVNDVAPVALELCAEQLEGNGIETYEVAPGPFEEVDLEGIDLVVACYVVYDPETRRAMARLLERTGERGIPALLANADIGGHFTRLLRGLGDRARELDGSWPEKGTVVLVDGDGPDEG